LAEADADVVVVILTDAEGANAAHWASANCAARDCSAGEQVEVMHWMDACWNAVLVQRHIASVRAQPDVVAAVAAHAMTQAGRAEGLGAAGELAGAVPELPWAATRAMRDTRGMSTCMVVVVVGIRRLSWSFFHLAGSHNRRWLPRGPRQVHHCEKFSLVSAGRER